MAEVVGDCPAGLHEGETLFMGPCSTEEESTAAGELGDATEESSSSRVKLTTHLSFGSIHFPANSGLDTQREFEEADSHFRPPGYFLEA